MPIQFGDDDWRDAVDITTNPDPQTWKDYVDFWVAVIYVRVVGSDPATDQRAQEALLWGRDEIIKAVIVATPSASELAFLESLADASSEPEYQGFDDEQRELISYLIGVILLWAARERTLR